MLAEAAKQKAQEIKQEAQVNAPEAAETAKSKAQEFKQDWPKNAQEIQPTIPRTSKNSQIKEKNPKKTKNPTKIMKDNPNLP